MYRMVAVVNHMAAVVVVIVAAGRIEVLIVEFALAAAVGNHAAAT